MKINLAGIKQVKNCISYDYWQNNSNGSSLYPCHLMFSGMAILVGLSFFFLLVAENMPATSEAVPLVGMYYTVTMIEVSCAFFMTCWVLRFHHRNPTEGEVPKWVKVSMRERSGSQ